jgi:hypothetical protein
MGEVHRRVFRVRNGGDSTLYLGEVRSTCGCLAAAISSKDLEPGATAEITAELHADKGPGRLDKLLRIATNDAARPWIDLELGCDVAVLYELDPPFTDLPDLVLGEARDVEIGARGADGKPVDFAEATRIERGFTASVEKTAPAAARVRLRFTGSAPPGRRLFHVVFPATHLLVRELRIPVQAFVLPRLQLSPGDRIDFGRVTRASGAKVEVLVRSRSREPLAGQPSVIVDLTGGRRGDAAGPPPIRVETETIEPGREWKLAVILEKDAELDALVGRLTVRIDAPDEPPQLLALTGTLER